MRVSDGIRTHDRLDHNQELYQLSYAHRGRLNLASCRPSGRTSALDPHACSPLQLAASHCPASSRPNLYVAPVAPVRVLTPSLYRTRET